MTTTMANCRIELSKQIGDYLAGTATSTGDSTSLIDTQLTQYANDWITNWTWDFMTGTTNEGEERRISSLDNTSGDCTLVTAHTAAVASTSTYEIHRLFPATQKRRALIYAARAGYPYIHEKIRDESIVSGNWLKDGSLEIWTSGTELTHWTDDGTVILAKTETSPYYKHGTYSCLLGTAAGYIHQDITNWDDLKRLAGKTVTFTVQGYCATADTLRIAIYDGTTTTYSDHRTAEAAWTENSDPLSVTATIQDNPTAIEFHILLDTANNAYVDDARVIADSTDKPRLYIADLGLAQERPVQVQIEPSYYSNEAIWPVIHNVTVDTENGYLNLPTGVSNDYRLRIIGMGYLDFLASGVSSTAWTSTINIEKPQTDILIAQAALYLYTEMAMPNFSQGDRDDFMEMMGFWKQELRDRIGRHGMPIPSAITKWR